MKMRSELKTSGKLIVIKVGSLGVTSHDGGIQKKQISTLTNEISFIKSHGFLPILVSSGAINAGRNYLGKIKNEELSYLQACSSIGQPKLMEAFAKSFKRHSLEVAQVLLTHDDFKNRDRYLNARNTIFKLVDNNIVPIVNENDCVSFDEITVGDNDQLSAMLCEMVGADILIMLSRADGLFESDPLLNKNATHINQVPYDESFEKIKMFSKTAVGRGGMKTKIDAVKRVTPLGTSVVVGTFKKKNPLTRLLYSKHGTFFYPDTLIKKSRRKGWIASTVRNEALITVDKGAYHSLIKNGSLLPIGIIKIKGTFKRGDSVYLVYNNKRFAIGLSEFDSKDIEKVIGQKSNILKSLFGESAPRVIIHRNNLLNINKE